MMKDRKRPKLGEILVKKGIISPEDLAKAGQAIAHFVMVLGFR